MYASRVPIFHQQWHTVTTSDGIGGGSSSSSSGEHVIANAAAYTTIQVAAYILVDTVKEAKLSFSSSVNGPLHNHHVSLLFSHTQPKHETKKKEMRQCNADDNTAT